MTVEIKPTVDMAKLETFVGTKILPEAGGGWSIVMALIGEKAGLFEAMADAGPLTSEQVSQRSGVRERYAREWLSALAAAGWIDYDTTANTFELTPEQALVFAHPSPVNMMGAFETMLSAFHDHERVAAAYKSGEGVDWGDHHPCLFRGVERFFRNGYEAHLVQEWLPALDGVVEKLTAGAKLADVGCGHGASTIIMAKAFPNSEFVGFDYHRPSIEAAKKAAAAAGVTNARFEVAAAKTFKEGDFDVIAYFDCLHDMGDPVGASKHARSKLKADGTLFMVEPFANDELKDNLNPVGRLYYSASSCLCTPASLAQEVGLGLGAQAGEKRLREVVTQAGFTRFRRAGETPFNLILEARP